MFQVDKQLNYGREQILSFLTQIPQVTSCLDMGAGTGNDLLNVRSQFPKAQLTGIEGYSEYAKKLIEKGIKVLEINFENSKLPSASEEFDLVVCNQVMEHSKEIFWVLHEITRTLKPGGYLIIGVPNLASLHNRLLLLLGRQPTCIKNDSAHVRGYTKSDVLKLLEIFPKGYELVDFQGSNFYPFAPFVAKPLARLLPNMAVGIFLLLKKASSYDKNYFLEYPLTNQLETNFFLG